MLINLPPFASCKIAEICPIGKNIDWRKEKQVQILSNETWKEMIAAVSNWKLSFEPVMVIPDTSAVPCLSVRQLYALAESDGDSALSQANPSHRVCAPRIRSPFGSTFGL
jgi:hypothetical protein